MKTQHKYKIGLTWIGSVNVAKNYRYVKTYELDFENKPSIIGSADPTFHGDRNLYNPEEMLLSALSSCYMMSFFYLCSQHKIVIDHYTDKPTGIVKINPNGSGQFENVVLQPEISTSHKDVTLLSELFIQAKEYCFIARSCNFTIHHTPTIQQSV